MKEQIIDLSTAILAKVMGFHSLPEYEGSFYSKDGQEIKWGQSARLIEQIDCLAPTQSMLQKWLREEFGVHCNVHLTNLESKPYMVTIQFMRTKKFIPKNMKIIYPKDGCGDNYEKILEIGLWESLVLLPKLPKWMKSNKL